MSEPLLVFEQVTKRYGGTIAVDGFSAAVEAGKLTALIGPNGAGKTTLVGLTAGQVRPDEGLVRYRGEPLPPAPHRVARRGIGRLFQDVRVFANLTVLENLMTAAARLTGETVLGALALPRRVRADEAAAKRFALAQLERVGLADRAESLAGKLSYGQQKLVAIARLLAAGAETLLLDEPASGVHPRRVEELAILLRRLVDEGQTILLIEHNMPLVREVSDFILLMDRGRCRLAGPAAQVFASEELAEVYLSGEEDGAG